MRDSIVIGVGPAGISAAIYLNNLNKNVLVLGKDLGQLTPKDVIENFYGQSPIKGSDLIQKGINQAKELGIDVLIESVLSVTKEDNHFHVKTTRQTYVSKTVVLATGKTRLPLRVPGFNNFRGKGIHMCATCDGFFYKHKKIALIGSGPYMEQELSALENYTNDILIFTQGISYTNDKYAVILDPVKSFSGDDRINFVHTENNQYEVKGVFVAIGFPTASELSLKLGVVTEYANIVVDENMQTNIAGVFAGGDCIGGKLQIAKAVHDGLKIADGVNKYLKENKYGDN